VARLRTRQLVERRPEGLARQAPWWRRTSEAGRVPLSDDVLLELGGASCGGGGPSAEGATCLCEDRFDLLHFDVFLGYAQVVIDNGLVHQTGSKLWIGMYEAAPTR
jgi:hypothetical protein